MKALNEAYHVLGSAERRRAYDHERQQPVSPHAEIAATPAAREVGASGQLLSALLCLLLGSMLLLLVRFNGLWFLWPLSILAFGVILFGVVIAHSAMTNARNALAATNPVKRFRLAQEIAFWFVVACGGIVGRGFWAVTRYEDIVRSTRTPRPSPRPSSSTSRSRRRSSWTSAGRSWRPTAPATGRCASSSSATSVPPSCAATRTSCAASPRQTVETALQQHEFDFVDEISADFPIAGPGPAARHAQAMTPQLIDWGNQIVGISDPEYARVLSTPRRRRVPALSVPLPGLPGDLRVRPRAGRRAQGRRRRRPGEHAGQPHPGGRHPVVREHFDNYFLLLVIAGNETTRQAISQSMKALIDNPTSSQLAAGATRAGCSRRRGVAALGLAGLPLPPNRDPRRGDGRQADQGRRQGRHVVRLRQPRRVGVRRPLPLRRHPQERRT